MGLATSMTNEHDYMPQVEGTLPAGLRGTLYRNGPGRFDLGGHRKRHLLDGDGMIQAFRFEDGRVHYRNRFVQTRKFIKEQAAGRFLLPTWTTRAPGGLRRNAGNRIQSQAGVTTLVKNGCLYAFDEVGLPWGLNPDTLETLGEQKVGPRRESLNFKAHTHTDPSTGQWGLLAFQHGRQNTVHLVEHRNDMAFIRHQRIPVPRSSYVHDWFLTQRYAVVLLHPLVLSPLPFLSGLASFTESLSWRPQDGNLVLVVDREAEQKPLFLEAPASFMWHTLNAYDEAGFIVADFVGYQEPDHFVGENAALRQIMEGRRGVSKATGQLRRYRIDLKKRSVIEEVISTRNCEFPALDQRLACGPHRYGYFTTATEPGIFHHGLARINTETGQETVMDMGAQTHMGEPVFVPEPDKGTDFGWLLSLGLDGRTGKSFLGVFRADEVSAGPVARVLLNHATPLSFHGHWQTA